MIARMDTKVRNMTEGDPLKLPECTFIPAKGKTFDRWIAGNPDEYVNVSGSSTIRAFWKWVNPFYDIYSSDIYYDAVLWAYYADPLCGFPFTLNGYRGLMEAVQFSCKQENVQEKLKYCDAVCMGTAFKGPDGRVQKDRVSSFMEKVARIRAAL